MALDGAADRDGSEPERPPELARADRAVTARVIAESGADIIALQEVFDVASLDFFHERFLRPAGSLTYPHRICSSGNDGRGLNVAALCRNSPNEVRSHAAETGAVLGLTDLSPDLSRNPVFRRDCLELRFEKLTLFICHFKAPYPDPEKARIVREAEARAVRRIVERRFEVPALERWILLGDFNEPASGDDPRASALAPLRSGFSVDLLDRLTTGTDWTYELPETHLHLRPDRIFVSPRLAREYPETLPRIIRSGMQKGRPIPGESASSRPRASDHALVVADFPGL